MTIKLSKDELRDLGRAHGCQSAESVSETTLRMEPSEIYNIAGTIASARAADEKVRSTVYHEAFKQGFVQVWSRRRNDLPDIKAANRAKSLDYTLTDMVDAADSVLKKFAENFAVNPLYAFSWSSNVIEAAARKDAAIQLQAIVNGEQRDPRQMNGVQAAIDYALTQALRGARSPSQSTSPVSNLYEQAKVRAFADVAEKFYRYHE